VLTHSGGFLFFFPTGIGLSTPWLPGRRPFPARSASEWQAVQKLSAGRTLRGPQAALPYGSGRARGMMSLPQGDVSQAGGQVGRKRVVSKKTSIPGSAGNEWLGQKIRQLPHLRFVVSAARRPCKLVQRWV